MTNWNNFVEPSANKTQPFIVPIPSSAKFLSLGNAREAPEISQFPLSMGRKPPRYTSGRIHHCYGCETSLYNPAIIEFFDEKGHLSTMQLSLNKKKRWEELDEKRKSGQVIEVTHGLDRDTIRHQMKQQTEKREGVNIDWLVSHPFHRSIYKEENISIHRPSYIHRHYFPGVRDWADHSKSRGKGKGKSKWRREVLDLE